MLIKLKVGFPNLCQANDFLLIKNEFEKLIILVQT